MTTEPCSMCTPGDIQDPWLDAELTAADMELLLREQYIRPLESDEVVRGRVRVFSVLEKEDSRRRVVTCPDEINRLLVHPGGIELPHIDQLMAGENFHAITADFPSFYIQLGLENNRLSSVSPSRGAFLHLRASPRDNDSVLLSLKPFHFNL